MKTLNVTRLRIELARLNQTKSWLAGKLGMTKQGLNYHINKRRLTYVPQMARILRVKQSDLMEKTK